MIPDAQAQLDEIYLVLAAIEDIAALMLNEAGPAPGAQCLHLLSRKLLQEMDILSTRISPGQILANKI